MLWAALSSVVGAVLLVAGIPKVGDRDRMARLVRGYELLPDAAAGVVGAALPWVEIILGSVLLLGIAPSVGGIVSAALFVTFFAGLTANLLRGRRDIDCGCFAFGGGADEVERIGWWHSARAAAFAIVSVVVVVTPALSVLERVAGAGIGVFGVGLVCVGLYARSVMSFGRRPIDDYLSNAAIEMRAVQSVSRY
ncbi:methylamine utilization protein [Rhodococcus sp. Eu-32]|uniref:MauE/DoxX family redox-associated membrane protein n=1 Tax=Rhodococcus sp. Eu-32 TaxID=1017319 RepID=UPI000DF16A2C|nr:MauE/DoxX family redox-associated membrane protein [Rhodococcus sp. Eu-32]RRQ27483.1 methylamine utilization protein [Rhodococcus sp. Eu-32]